MKYLKFKGLLQKDGWISEPYVAIDAEGKISAITQEKPDHQEIEEVNGFAIPGIPNAHSHAFQYAMAGLAEVHATHQLADNFWSWRESMYQLACSVSPDDLQAIAEMLYAEMLRHGYTSVAEFHYVHHDQNGKPFENLAEMGERLVEAAKNTGIHLTLVPIFYQKGGLGIEPSERQKRFISKNADEYFKLWEASKKACSYYENASMGIGIHSIRAVETADILKTLNSTQQNLPVHIHVSEQLKEIEDTVAYLGKRPVEWFLENTQMNENFQLVHATHLTDEEVAGIAQTGAQVVICPTTEGNLGDGLFKLKQFQNQNGKWCIGTDSHVSLNPLEELRLLDYGQRLTSHQRNIFTSENQGDSGLYALQQAVLHGEKAMGNNRKDFFEAGTPLNALILDGSAPLLATSNFKNMASTVVYSTDVSMFLGTLVNGEWKVRSQKHVEGKNITSRFLQTIKQLKNR